MSDFEFVQERLEIVVELLASTDDSIEPKQRMQLQREHRLLGKILAQVPAGEVHATLKDWRMFLGGELKAHHIATRAQQEAFERWLRLPRHRKEHTPSPERPSLGVKVPDLNGAIWIIDDRFLQMMDDVIARLGKWLASNPT